MLSRAEPILKALCAVLALLLLVQFGRMIVHSNPLAHLVIPALPSLPPDTNAPAAGKATNTVSGATGGRGTNETNKAFLTNGTNVARGTIASHETNAVSGTSNSGAGVATKGGTNDGVKAVGTKGTNVAAQSDSARTNAAAGGKPGPGALSRGMPGKGGKPKAPDLPLPILARVDRITDSEILGPVIRPLPMALLGIAGNVAFLRTADGQTGLVKEGDSLGTLKLIRIGTNRVLVEDEGQPKELTIFSGYGGESLLAKEKEKSK